jgi:hypothetical protein
MPQLIVAGLVAIGVGTTVATVAGYVIGAAAVMGTTRLLTKRALKKAGAGGDGGGRVQIPPATDNKIPVVYGSAYMSGPIIDAHITADQKTMYYVLALAEKTDNGTISYGDIYYDGKLVTFTSDGLGGTTRVASLTTNSSTPQVDSRVDGNLFMYFYNNGSTSPTNTTLNAYDVMPSWTSSMAMTNCAFVIVEVKYNVDAATTNLGAVIAEVVNTESGQSTGVYRPGTAIFDYLTNTTYGCAIPSAKVNTASLDALNTYSDANITYTPVGGGSATQPRYRINGPLDTAASCLDNLQILVDSCDSWLQYSELSGEWKVVINAPYAGTAFAIDASNIIGGVQVNPLDLNDTYNQLEVAYPNENIKDQSDYQVLLLSDYQVGLLSPNEAVNRLNISYPIVNNAVQAKYLGVRRLLQSREDLVISINLDFSGIQIEAGDVVAVTHATYGWVSKLFRVSQVSEVKDQEGRLGASIVAFEYNATIYNDQAITDFIPAFNTGLRSPNVFDAPTVPVIATVPVSNASTTSFNVSSNVPSNGAVIYMDFNYGNSSNIQEHLLYRTVQPGPGTTFTANSNITINVNDIAAGNLYWSATARNDFAGRQSNASSEFVWAGPKVSDYDANTGQGGIGINELQPNIFGPNLFPPDVKPIIIVNTLPTCNATSVGSTAYLLTDGKLYICNGTNFEAVASNNLITGEIVASQIANVFGNTITGTIDNAGFPSANLIGNIVSSQISNIANTQIIGQIVSGQIANIANTQIVGQLVSTQIANVANTSIIGDIIATQVANTGILGDIVSSQIANAAITSDKLAANSVIAGKIFANAVTAITIATNAVTSDKILANAIIANKIAAGAVESDKILANAITADKILANAVVAGKIAADAVGANQITANAITAIKIQAGAVESDKILANAITSDKILANAIIAGKIAVDAVGANQILANAITAVKISANAITTDKIEANAIVTSKILAGSINAALLAANAVVAGTIAANAMSLGSLISDTTKTFDGANFQFELGTGTTIGGYGGAGIFRTQKVTSFAIGGLNTSSDSFAVAGQSTSNTGGGYGAAFVNSTAAGSNTHRTEAYFASSDQAGLFSRTGANIFATMTNSTYAIETIGDVSVTGNITATGTITPFTGSHNGLVDKTVTLSLGDILVDDYVIAKYSINDVLTQMSISNVANQPAIGVYSGDCIPSYIPLPISQPGPQIQIALNTWMPGPVILANAYANILDDNKVIVVNSVGEGQINVIGENGNIQIGDLIVTSSVPGKGMKQTDDVVRSITVAKARENVTFATTTEEKQIACIYLAG